jgi:hypothetical protein
MKHWEYHPEPIETCFGCKGLSIQMNAGDADSRRLVSNKKFNKELDAYKEARSQGIQPAGTSMEKIQEAVKASETLGRAYNAEKMPPAKHINKQSAAVMKELGA